MQYNTLRPGLLVSLKTSITGNVAYRRQDIEAEHITAEGQQRARWETERVIEDPAEHEAAVKIRGKCRSLITAVCAASSFGLLCPEDRAGDLDAALREANELANDFNRTASLTRIGVYLIAGRIAPDDVEAVRAINSEVRSLLSDMEDGLQRLDVQVVRDAANKARALGSMLSPDAAGRIKTAIDAARSAARRIVKAGEAGAVEIDHVALRAVTTARTAFLDLDDAEEIAAPETTGRAIDLEPEPAPMARAAAPAFLFDLD